MHEFSSDMNIREELNITTEKQKKNRLKLADMLEHRVTDKQFNMATFSNDCGTVGCALGIAALSGEFKELGWNRDRYGKISPVVRGTFQEWDRVGAAFFGKATMDDVFWSLMQRSREDVANELRAVED